MASTSLFNNYRYRMIFILFLLWIVVYWQRVNISMLLLDMTFLSEMGLIGEGAKQGMLMTLFLIPYSLANIVGAPLGDWLGPRKTMIIGLLLAALAMLMGGMAAGLMTIFAARVLLGIGQGIYYPTQSIIVKKWFPPEERGTANAIYGIGCIGPLFAMPIFTFLMGSYGWQWVFYLVAGLGLISLVPLVRGQITDEPDVNKYIGYEEKEYLDKKLNGVSQKNIVPETPRMQGLKTIATSGEVWLITVAYICFLSIWWGIVTWLPQYLMVARGFSLQALGFMASAPYVTAAAGVMMGGILSDKISRRAEFGYAALLGASLCVVIAALTPSNIMSAVFIIVAPAFLQLFYAPTWSIIQKILPDNLIGTGSGFINGLSNLLSASAPLVIGVLLQVTHSYVSGLIYLAVMGAIGSLSCYLLSRRV